MAPVNAVATVVTRPVTAADGSPGLTTLVFVGSTGRPVPYDALLPCGGRYQRETTLEPIDEQHLDVRLREDWTIAAMCAEASAVPETPSASCASDRWLRYSFVKSCSLEMPVVYDNLEYADRR